MLHVKRRRASFQSGYEVVASIINFIIAYRKTIWNAAILLWNPSSVAMESKQCCYGIQAVLLWNPSSVAMESQQCCYGIQAVLLWNTSSVAMESKDGSCDYRYNSYQHNVLPISTAPLYLFPDIWLLISAKKDPFSRTDRLVSIASRARPPPFFIPPFL